MLKFYKFVQQLEGANVHDASMEAEVRASVLAAMNRIQQLHTRIVNDKTANNGVQQLSEAITELASLMCVIAGLLTDDRVLIQRGA